MQQVLIIAAHSDDETLGCGGTIARHIAQGDELSVIFMTNGVGSRTQHSTECITNRAKATDAAMEILGVKTHRSFDFPDNALDTVPLLEITKAIEEICNEWGIPKIVYTHCPHDLNIDHRTVYEATMTCFRPQPSNGNRPEQILTYEVLSSTGWRSNATPMPFLPNYFVDITDHIATKMKALDAYAEEMRPWPHARSLQAVEALAQVRGSHVGLKYAEAFSVERIITTL
ncbi:PIG-L family deacetylase [Rhodopirellula sp.]|nr:PIG-L family deacetylase [Rhodopirellula sp.]